MAQLVINIRVFGTAERMQPTEQEAVLVLGEVPPACASGGVADAELVRWRGVHAHFGVECPLHRIALRDALFCIKITFLQLFFYKIKCAKSDFFKIINSTCQEKDKVKNRKKWKI